MNKRYETKFSLLDLDYYKVINFIKSHPAMFQEIHTKRNVNNIYFDNLDLTSYVDNVEGERDRKKVRIRWYGNLFGICKNPFLEIKVKSGLLGWKEKYKLNNFTLDKNNYFDYEKILNNFNLIKDFETKKINIQSLVPSLLNSYERIYYLSFDKKYRITLDKNMRFYSINPINNHFSTFVDTQKIVLELKYNQIYSEGANYITNFFPFRVTKNSKYVVGIERLRNWK